MFPLRFSLVRICPNDNFIEIFAQRYHYFEDPCYKSFALNLLYQDTSYSLAIKCFKFFSFAFYNINFWFKISKICPKILHFSQISHSRGNTDYNGGTILFVYDGQELELNFKEVAIYTGPQHLSLRLCHYFPLLLCNRESVKG